MIYGDRIEQARKLSGFTQKQLASKVGVNQSAIAQFERDICTPSEETIKAIASFTGFQIPFFYQPPINTDFSEGSLSYRSLRSVSAKEEERSYQYGKLLYEHIYKMAQSLTLPPVQIAKLKEKPEKAAEIARAGLGLAPDTPIPNLINTIEKNGVIVISLPLFLQKIDAFSTWAELRDMRPIIAISAGKTGDRLRFSIAHELGHLIMHSPPRVTAKLMEKEANEFAAAFLMPKNSIYNELLMPVSLYGIAKLKVRWGVSMKALIYRARDLKIITPRQATYLFTQMSSLGWRNAEPGNLDVKIENPQIFRKMIETLYDSPDKYAIDMYLRSERATELTLYA